MINLKYTWTTIVSLLWFSARALAVVVDATYHGRLTEEREVTKKEKSCRLQRNEKKRRNEGRPPLSFVRPAGICTGQMLRAMRNAFSVGDAATAHVGLHRLARRCNMRDRVASVAYNCISNWCRSRLVLIPPWRQSISSRMHNEIYITDTARPSQAKNVLQKNSQRILG